MFDQRKWALNGLQIAARWNPGLRVLVVTMILFDQCQRAKPTFIDLAASFASACDGVISFRDAVRAESERQRLVSGEDSL